LILGLLVVFVLLPRWQVQRHNRLEKTAQQMQFANQEPPAVEPVETASPSPTAVPPVLSPTVAPPSQPRSTPLILIPKPTREIPKTDREYVEAMSSALEAIEREQWETARDALERAARLKPGAPEVVDGLARLSAGQRREHLIANTRRARELEQAEAWHEAEKTYASVLAVDPEAATALDGRDRSAARATLDDKIRYHLSNPSRLASPSVLEDASALLEEARAASPRGPRLISQVRQLEELIETASRPLPVVIESDGLTDVVVHRVGRLGTFSRREINLRPGTYTAVGSRTGFRDVRVRFRVDPGKTQGPVVVRCTENL